MMRIQVILGGKLRERYLREGVAEYQKRLGPHARLELIEVQDPRRLLAAAAPGAYLVALDLRGRMLSSEAFASFLQERALQGDSTLTFLIGGAEGLPAETLAAARFRLCLSPMTFPHQLVALILAEQIYRAFTILAGGPYHK